MNKNKRCAILMYHYVLPDFNSGSPEDGIPWQGLKGIGESSFKAQLDWLAAHANIINPSQLLEGGDLPPRAVLLTFDDGYKGHYKTVFPLLRERSLAAIFAPVIDAVRGSFLDVNMIHLILASGAAEEEITAYIDCRILQNSKELGFTGDSYRKDMIGRRLDSPLVSFIKDMLQKVLPEGLRHELLLELFARYAGGDQRKLADNFYLSPFEIEEMAQAGMYFSIHGLTHRWFTHLSFQEAKRELEQALSFYDSLGISNLSVTWPYGASNKESRNIALNLDIDTGFGTTCGIAEIGGNPEAMLSLPRIDARDAPGGEIGDFSPGLEALLEHLGLDEDILENN